MKVRSGLAILALVAVALAACAAPRGVTRPLPSPSPTPRWTAYEPCWALIEETRIRRSSDVDEDRAVNRCEWCAHVDRSPQQVLIESAEAVIFLRADATGNGPDERADAHFEALAGEPGPAIRREPPMLGADRTALLVRVSERPIVVIARCANAVLVWTVHVTAEVARGLTLDDLNERVATLSPGITCANLR
ncbi:hypothetical protein Val02_09770 [Virgisporangium aliadipatigenens]|uniref:Lipoprotein n=1 Tax=Virgisporangium aliadipatigenens TaxID=741659 RepID=A0A8J3YHM1_9ACTN|nr:hypothetical protein [Virgisporangium aliadipatigenens]GIJ44091.1 hypothetical protein Val02_09770 [Virgisporangium aliadipatigenens]